MNVVGRTAGLGHRGQYRLRSCIAAFIVGAIASASLAFTSPANAATPVIVNQSSTGGQTNWLESFTTGGEGAGGDHRAQIKISLLVKHDPGRKVTGIKVDDDYDSGNNTTSKSVKAVSAQQPTMQGGYQYSRISLTYNAPSGGTELGCPVFGSKPRRSTKPLRVLAVLDNNEQTGVSTSDIHFVATGQCLSAEDYPYIKTRSQSATSINTDQSVTFTYNGDDPDVTGSSDFGGVNYRLRRLSDGRVVNKGKSCPANGDNADKTLNVTFPDRGRWVVEAELLNNNDCNTNDNAGRWWNLGTVDVNSPAVSSPTLSLNATRPMIGGNSTITATTDDPEDSSQGGRVEAIEWDLNQSTGDGVNGFEVALLGDTAAGVVASQKVRTVDTTGMTPGLKTVRARVTDNGAMGGADNIRRTNTVSTTFLVDTPPVAAADSVATETGADLPIQLAGTDADGDTLTYTVTAPPTHGNLSGTGANQTYTSAAGFAGTDQFTFQVADGYGGTDTAVVSITVDPNINPFTGPAGTIDDRSTSVGFGSDATGATFECSLDSATWTACSSPFTASDLADGEHDVRVRAIAGGLTSAHKTSTWTVDAFPKIAVTDAPDAETSTADVAVAFTLDETGSTVPPASECRLDGHGWHPCLSPVSYTGLDDGDHQISIRATDAFGKQTTEDVNWTVVTAGTSTTIVAPFPPAFTRDGNAAINFNNDGDVAGFECSLDGGPWDPCTSPSGLTGLADGSHTLRVRSINGLDVPEALPARISWTVDGTPPVATVTTGPEGATRSGPAAFAFKSNESLSRFECSVDGANFAPCSSPYRLADDLADGPHNFRVAAIDRAGNRSLAAQQNFRILSFAPQVSLTGGPAQGAVTTSSAATFGFVTDPASAGFECSVDGAEWAECSPPATMTGLVDGPHSFSVQAIDEVGNRSLEPTTRDWTIDTTAPETTITAGPAGLVRSADGKFEFTASEAGSTFECSVDGAAFAACVSPADLAGLTDGGHEFRVRATDTAGNRDQSPAARSWSIDTSPLDPPDELLPAAEPDPCTFLIEQDRCGDPYVVASVRAPYRARSGKASIKIDIDSGGSALGRASARLPIGLKALALKGKRGARIGQIVLTGESRRVLGLKLPAKRSHNAIVSGIAGGVQPVVTLKPRTVIVEGLPAGVTGIKIRLKSTKGLRIVTSICGTRLWRTILTDSSANREDVDARADITCIRKVSR